MEKHNRFDELMFGKKQMEESEEPEEKDENSFNLFQTVQLLNDTYKKLSPIKDMFKNIK
ncbi:hypothetical protein [Gracilibacillus suaedae]|uniref:hypothetical protein n=1 Tax=Gracilibacillus suaedae TaxID=2820273 RepID=UPI001ABEA976|nr:hypothetical protein [Gracilibacillus suaedae]